MDQSEFFDVLNGHEYINLKTFRRSGEAVLTPVWFKREGDALYITTQRRSGKVKRIYHTAAVEIAPCKFNGELLGEWLPAYASLLDDSVEQQTAVNALAGKYGHTEMWERVMQPENAASQVYIKIQSRD